jgi:ribosomal 50S subunit-associated protein YjgA (DUF615 family)
MPDNPSTELALIHLIRDKLGDLAVLVGRIERLEHNTQHRHTELMTALETLTQSVTQLHDGDAALTTAVNAAITQLGQPGATDAQLLTLASVIDTKTASDAALTTALTNAVTPVVTPPTP